MVRRTAPAKYGQNTAPRNREGHQRSDSVGVSELLETAVQHLHSILPNPPLNPERSLAQKVVGRNNHLNQLCYDHYDGVMRKTAAGLSPLIAIDRKTGTPLHAQIYEAFRAAILARNLRAGERISVHASARFGTSDFAHSGA